MIYFPKRTGTALIISNINPQQSSPKWIFNYNDGWWEETYFFKTFMKEAHLSNATKEINFEKSLRTIKNSSVYQGSGSIHFCE